MASVVLGGAISAAVAFFNPPAAPVAAPRYAYAGDDPINGNDLTGRIDCLGSSILAVGGIAVTAVFIASTGGLALAFATPFALFGVFLALDTCAKQYN